MLSNKLNAAHEFGGKQSHSNITLHLCSCRVSTIRLFALVVYKIEKHTQTDRRTVRVYSAMVRNKDTRLLHK